MRQAYTYKKSINFHIDGEDIANACMIVGCQYVLLRPIWVLRRETIDQFINHKLIEREYKTVRLESAYIANNYRDFIQFIDAELIFVGSAPNESAYVCIDDGNELLVMSRKLEIINYFAGK